MHFLSEYQHSPAFQITIESHSTSDWKAIYHTWSIYQQKLRLSLRSLGGIWVLIRHREFGHWLYEWRFHHLSLKPGAFKPVCEPVPAHCPMSFSLWGSSWIQKFGSRRKVARLSHCQISRLMGILGSVCWNWHWSHCVEPGKGSIGPQGPIPACAGLGGRGTRPQGPIPICAGLGEGGASGLPGPNPGGLGQKGVVPAPQRPIPVGEGRKGQHQAPWDQSEHMDPGPVPSNQGREGKVLYPRAQSWGVRLDLACRPALPHAPGLWDQKVEHYRLRNLARTYFGPGPSTA